MNIFSTGYYYARLISGIIRLNRNPERTDLVFVVGESLFHLGKFQETQKIISASPESLQVIAEKKLIDGYLLEELAKLPTGTLGRVYADHMIGLKLNPEFYPRPNKLTDATYIMLRMRQTHDLWHVITGFDTSVAGEIGLQAFMMAQIAAPLSIVIIGSSLLRTAIKNQERVFSLMDSVVKGWKMGRQAKLVFPYDWQKAWPKDLQTIRNELLIGSTS